jgi:hypothetical protein
MKKLLARKIFLALVLSIGLPAADAFAQMYRCGNVYQDRPCDATQPAGKPVTGVGSGRSEPSAAAPSSGAANAECAQRGVDSQKIVWSREGGVTEQKMLSEESNSAKRKLITDVYRERGTAPEVRARIEAECRAEMAEKAKAQALANALIRAGVLPSGQPSASAGSGERSAAEQQAQQAQQAQQLAQREAADKAERCKRISKAVADNREMQRQGGDRDTMERFNRERADLDRLYQKFGCR